MSMYRPSRRGFRRRRGRGRGVQNGGNQGFEKNQISQMNPMDFMLDQSEFFNGMNDYSFMNSNSNRDMMFSRDDYMEHKMAPFKNDMNSFRMGNNSQQSGGSSGGGVGNGGGGRGRGKRRKFRKRQSEDSQNSSEMRENVGAGSSMMNFGRPQQAAAFFNPFMAAAAAAASPQFQMQMARGGMMGFGPAAFGFAAAAKRMRMEPMNVPPPGQGKSKRALRKKKLKAKAKEGKEEEGEEEEEKGEDPEAKEEPPKPEEKKVRKKVFFNRGRFNKQPFRCHYCKADTKDWKGLEEHVQKPEHKTATTEKETNFWKNVFLTYQTNEEMIHSAIMMGREVKLCHVCFLRYVGPVAIHRRSREHKMMFMAMNMRCHACDLSIPTRVQYDKHLLTKDHIRNHHNRMMKNGIVEEEELDFDGEYDPEKELGVSYVVDMRVHYCEACDKLFKFTDCDPFDHCKTPEHHAAFKVFAEVRKAEKEKKRLEEEEEKKRQEEERKKEEAEKKEENGGEAEEMQDDDVGEDAEMWEAAAEENK